MLHGGDDPSRALPPALARRSRPAVRQCASTPSASRAPSAWDEFGEQGKAAYFADVSARNPAGRIGTTDIANGVLLALTSTFLSGQTLRIDGGEPLT